MPEVSTATATVTSGSTPAAHIPTSLESHNTHFTKLLSLIPARYYIPLTQEEADSKWMKNKKNKAGGVEEGKENKKRARLEKFDPANTLTADQILAGASTSTKAVSEPTSSRPTASTSSLPPQLPPQLAPLPPSSSISDLRARMRAKLGNMAAARGVPNGEGDGEGMHSRDALMNAQRARRAELRDNRRDKRKAEMRKAAETGKTAKNHLIVPTHSSGPSDGLTYQNMSLPSSKGSSFSKSLPGLKKLSNASQALTQLEKHNARLSGLTGEARKEAEEKERWAKAELRASGGKVADEEKVLKKAVKREEKRKQKSGKEWAERKKELDRSQAVAIKKRSDNIANRAEARRNKRLGIKDKTGKAGKGKAGFGGKGKGSGGGKGRPGFEGKSNGKGGKSNGKKPERR